MIGDKWKKGLAMLSATMKVHDCMTSNPVTIQATESLRAAEKVMKEYNVRHLPVVKNDKLVGMLSSGDIRRASPSDAVSLSIWEINYLWDRLTVESAMTREVKTVTPETPLLDAVRLMFDYRFNSLPVIDTAGHPVGILTEVDVFRVLLYQAEFTAGSAVS
jgi:CBS domain-containing protein